MGKSNLIQEDSPKQGIKKSKEKPTRKTIELVNKEHFEDMKHIVIYHGFKLEIKESYVALIHGYKGSIQGKTWKNEIFNKITREEITLFLKKYRRDYILKLIKDPLGDC